MSGFGHETILIPSILGTPSTMTPFYAIITKKNGSQTDFEGKKQSCKEIYIPAKKISIMAYCWEKILHSHMSGKKITCSEVSERKFLPRPNHPYSPSKGKWSTPYLPGLIAF